MKWQYLDTKYQHTYIIFLKLSFYPFYPLIENIMKIMLLL